MYISERHVDTYGKVGAIFAYGIKTWLSTDSYSNIGLLKFRICG
jgi:hypothetical protein